jgi:fermentation-respiration switch protein FrsA (DUF1100 family)
VGGVGQRADRPRRASAAQVGFANPAAAMTIEDIPDLPMLLVRAGADATVGLNATIDAFVATMRSADRSLALVDHADAPHAFDMLADNDHSRRVIDEVLRFLVSRLTT